jgi:hypothetical protein
MALAFGATAKMRSLCDAACAHMHASSFKVRFSSSVVDWLTERRHRRQVRAKNNKARSVAGRPSFWTELDMTLLNLTFLILTLNYLVDRGLHARVSLDEVKHHIRRGDVLDWLGQWFKGYVDVGPYMRDRIAYDGITKGPAGDDGPVLPRRAARLGRQEQWHLPVDRMDWCSGSATRLAGIGRMLELRPHRLGMRDAPQPAVQDVQQAG